MRRKATDALGLGVRHETLDASEAGHETRDVRRVSSLSSRNLVSRLTSHAPAPWPKVKLGEEGGARHETIDASIASSLASKNARVSRLTSHAPWPTVLLGEVTIMKRGKYITRNDTSPGDVPVILGGQEPAYYCDKANHTGPCVVISRSGASAGFVSYWAQPIFVTDGFLFEANEQSNIRYVYYCLKANQSLLGNMQNGTGIPHVRGDDLKSFQIPLPPLPVQRRIADVLSAYDDLIENNRRRIAILEETARLAYRKWFGGSGAKGGMRHETIDEPEVGRETRDVRRVSSLASHARVLRLTSHAQLRTVTLGEICHEVRRGVSPDAIAPDTPYIGLEHMPRRSISLCEWESAQKITSTKLAFETGDILFGKIRPYFHKVGIAFVDGVASSDAIVIKPNSPELLAYVLMTVSSDAFVAAASQGMKEGSKMPRADWKQLLRYCVVLPDAETLSAFNKVLNPILAQLKTLCFSIRNLAAARDLLLPRLMKGAVA